MSSVSLPIQIQRFLKKKEFLNVGTCDLAGRPNVAPKFLLKVSKTALYLVDYVLGRTFRNITSNPVISLSTVDMESLTGYQINGRSEVLTGAKDNERMLRLLREKQIAFSTKRIIAGVREEKTHTNFELTFPEKVVVFKVHIKEVVKIGPRGDLIRKSAP